jgi:hypothetical protein
VTADAQDNEVAGFDDAVFGRDLPEAARLCIADAGLLRGSHPGFALDYLRRARHLAPEHPATLIALYRFYFYDHQLREARTVATDALCLGARMLGLPERWQDIPARPLPGARFDAGPRFFLFALKAYAYLSLRLGETDLAAPTLALLKALDPEDRVGGALLDVVLARAGRDDEGYEDERVAAAGMPA